MKSQNYAIIALAVTCILAPLSRTASADTLQLWFFQDDKLTAVGREAPAGTLDAAMAQLVAGPTTREASAGLTSRIPAGTTVLAISAKGDQLDIELSAGVLADGMTEAKVEGIYRQINLTARPYHSAADVHITSGGMTLSEYLPVPPEVTPRAKSAAIVTQAAAEGITTGALSGHSITLSPGHGYMWNGNGWNTQRPMYCSPLLEEDYHNLEICQYLETYLLADGMTVKMCRCTNKNYGQHYTGKEWWQMAGYLWLQHEGYPCSVYAPATGDCNYTGAGASESSDEVWSRPLSSNLDGTDIYISVHTNGLSGNCTGTGCPTGTETYYDAGTEHAAWGDVSHTLANNVSDNVIATLVNQVDSTWICNTACVKNSNGAYGEIRLPQRAAILTELAFHDTCDRDADTSHLRDNFFRSACMWGIYKGVCDYFGTTPTWDFYSCEYVSDTLPASMSPGESRSVTIALRNRGVLWKSARSFSLGAVGDSDPFSASNRISVTGEFGPGTTCPFTFTITAPTTPGVYTCDWQMVRDGFAWFGPVVSRQIVVGDPPTMLVSDNFESYADQAAMEAVWTDSGNSEYQLDATFGNSGKSVRMPSPSADLLGVYSRGLGGTFPGTDAEPLVFQYDLYLDPTGSPSWTDARHFCELRGYSGGAYGNGTLQNTVAIGLNNASIDTFSTTRYQGYVADAGMQAQWHSLDAQAAAPSRSSGWHKMKMTVKSTQIDFAIDGTLAESVARTLPAGFNCVVLGSDLTAGGHQSYVDNVQVYVQSYAPVIAVQPADLAACSGATAPLSIQVNGHGLSYQWQYNGTDLVDGGRISGARSANLSIGNVGTSDVGEYRCVVSNSLGTVTSDTAQLTLRPAVTVTQHPQSVLVAMGGNTAFTAAASGDSPLSYRWYLNGRVLNDTTLIAGSSTAVLSITDVRADNVGTYKCVVTTPCGTLSTDSATLTLTTLTGDFDNDGDVDMKDFGQLQGCLSGPGVAYASGCDAVRIDQDADIDQSDVEFFQLCLSGPNVAGNALCVGP